MAACSPRLLWETAVAATSALEGFGLLDCTGTGASSARRSMPSNSEGRGKAIVSTYWCKSSAGIFLTVNDRVLSSPRKCRALGTDVILLLSAVTRRSLKTVDRRGRLSSASRDDFFSETRRYCLSLAFFFFFLRSRRPIPPFCWYGGTGCSSGIVKEEMPLPLLFCLVPMVWGGRILAMRVSSTPGVESCVASASVQVVSVMRASGRCSCWRAEAACCLATLCRCEGARSFMGSSRPVGTGRFSDKVGFVTGWKDGGPASYEVSL